MIDQQAPPTAWHSSLLEFHKLSIKAHRTNGGMIFQRTYRAHQGQQGIVPGAEEIGPEPAHDADMGPRRFDRFDR